MISIGIIGYGYVGKAVSLQFKGVRSHVVDVSSELRPADLITECEVSCVFVCVPTPNINGRCDVSTIHEILAEINAVGDDALVVIKSTVPPDELAIMTNEYEHIRLAHVPEFLTQANYASDALTPEQIIIGADSFDTGAAVSAIYRNYFSSSLPSIHIVDLGTASLAKYAINCMLATKVTFMNQMYELFEESDNCTDAFSTLEDIISSDSRIGKSHTCVPGPDKKYGFGGACFPKDTEALVTYSDSIDIPFDMLKAAIEQNKHFRSKR